MSKNGAALPDAVVLADRGLVVRLSLHPMPTPAADGSYPLISQQAPRITLAFLRNNEIIDQRDWSDAITGFAPILLADGSSLERDDVDAIDRAGGEILSRYGIVPTVWVEPMLASSHDKSNEAAEVCPMCGGTGGWPEWPDNSRWVTCKPCDGTGASASVTSCN